MQVFQQCIPGGIGVLPFADSDCPQRGEKGGLGIQHGNIFIRWRRSQHHFCDALFHFAEHAAVDFNVRIQGKISVDCASAGIRRRHVCTPEQIAPEHCILILIPADGRVDVTAAPLSFDQILSSEIMHEFDLDAAVVGDEIDFLHQLRPVIGVTRRLGAGNSAAHVRDNPIEGMPDEPDVLMCKDPGHKYLVIQPPGKIVFVFQLAELARDHVVPAPEGAFPFPVERIEGRILFFQTLPECFQAVFRIADRASQKHFISQEKILQLKIFPVLFLGLFQEGCLNFPVPGGVGITGVPYRVRRLVSAVNRPEPIVMTATDGEGGEIQIGMGALCHSRLKVSGGEQLESQILQDRCHFRTSVPDHGCQISGVEIPSGQGEFSISH